MTANTLEGEDEKRERDYKGDSKSRGKQLSCIWEERYILDPVSDLQIEGIHQVGDDDFER